MKIFIVISILSFAVSVSGRRLPPEYEADDEELPPRLEDIPDKYYDSLMQELPELSEIAAEYTARRNSPAYSESRRYIQQYNTNSFNFSKQSGRRIYQKNPQYPEDKMKQNWNANNFITKKVLYLNKRHFFASSCYWCGMNLSYFIPTTSLCHDVFESADYSLRSLQRFFRGKCYHTNPYYVNFAGETFGTSDLRYFGTFQGWNNFIYGSYYHNTTGKDTEKLKWGTPYNYDYGLKKNYFGQYTGGCFKRYLDVGTIYTQRGCRHYWPLNTYGDSPIAHRFKKLEYVLRWKDEGCVTSNHASLTPFNRGISLFARYYVCVCSTRYCNRAANSTLFSNILLSVAVLFTCSFNIHRI